MKQLGGQIWWTNCVEKFDGIFFEKLVANYVEKLCGQIVWKNWLENCVEKLVGKLC